MWYSFITKLEKQDVSDYEMGYPIPYNQAWELCKQADESQGQRLIPYDQTGGKGKEPIFFDNMRHMMIRRTSIRASQRGRIKNSSDHVITDPYN